MIHNVGILGVGHPRTGSKMLQILLNSWGLATTHEGHSIHGIISWQFATDADAPLPAYRLDEVSQKVQPRDYTFENIIYHIRDPFYSIPSIALTETFSLKFRSKWGNFEISENRVENTIKSILAWDKLILEKNPDIIFRIEYDTQKLFDFIKNVYGDGVSMNTSEWDNKHNKRNHQGWDVLMNELEQVDVSLLEEMNNFCHKYGYKKIFDTSNKSLIREDFNIDDMRIVPNSEHYYEFIRELRTHPSNLDGFVEHVEITTEQQIEYMSKYGKDYEICLEKKIPVGFIGVVDNDIRFAVSPEHHGKGIGTYMIWDLIHKKPNSKAKVKHNNLASIKVFERCGFKLYNKDENFLYYSL